MLNTRLQLAPPRAIASLALATGFGVAVTLLVSVGDLLFAYRNVSLHVAVETTAALASLVAAQSIYGRFARSLQRRDLVLTAALVVFAATNLLLSAIPSILSGEPGSFRAWAPVLGRLSASALLAAAAWLPPGPLHRPALAKRRALLACGGLFALIVGFVVLAGDELPAVVRPSSSPDGGPQIDRDAFVLGVQLVSTLLFSAAAVGFSRRALRTDDGLTRWLAVSTILGTFARLNYLLFPSLYSAWFYAGDGLRLLSFLALFAGGIGETRRIQQALSASAVLDERRRIARELHDGVTQDLAFVVQQLRYGEAVDRRQQTLPVVAAAERALDESRNAIAALVRPAHVSLAEALTETAREAAEREGALVEIDVVEGIAVPDVTQQELLRVVREAVINAVRHGGARHVRLELREQPLRVRVLDDGIGFEVEAAQRDGHFGIEAMTARIAALGGRLVIESDLERGTQVEMTLP
jgi:signal transduction histidine kinase